MEFATLGNVRNRQKENWVSRQLNRARTRWLRLEVGLSARLSREHCWYKLDGTRQYAESIAEFLEAHCDVLDTEIGFVNETREI